MKKLSLLALTLALYAGAAQAEPYCREYTEMVKIGNTQQQGYGTACLQPDGSWQKVNAAPQPVIQPVETTMYIIEERPVYYRRPAPLLIFGSYHYPNRPYNRHYDHRRGGRGHH